MRPTQRDWLGAAILVAVLVVGVLLLVAAAGGNAG